MNSKPKARAKPGHADAKRATTRRARPAAGRSRTPARRATQYQRLFEGAPHGILVLDARTGAIEDVNPYLSRLSGYSRAELVGKKLWEISAFEELGASQAALDAWQTNGRSQRESLLLKAKDGRLIEMEFDSNAYEVNRRKLMQCHFRGVGGRVQTDESLPPAEAELRALFAAMYDVVLVIDRLGVYRKIAPTKPGLLFKPPHELLGKNLRDVFPPEQAAAFLLTVKQVLKTRQSVDIEYELLINGRLLWFAATISPMDSDSTLWVAHDITPRKMATDALRAAEERYRALQENAWIGIYQSTPQGRFLHVNPTMARIFGYDSPEDMIDGVDSIEEQFYVNPSDRREFQRLMQEHGRVQEFAIWARRKDGQPICIQENARAVADADGRLLYYEGFVSDITERMQADETLREAEASYRNLFENALEGIFQSTPEGMFVVANPALARMLGYGSPEELIASVNDLNHEFYVAPGRRAEVMRELSERGMITDLESEVYRKDGSTIWISENAQVVRDDTGRTYYAGMLFDITSRKQVEEELRRAKAELEILNRDLSQSLTREEALARTDALTGLANRTHFGEQAAREFQTAVRYQQTLAIIMMDTDDLKRINDTLGHGAGDRALTMIAQTLTVETRASDTLARIGGDEFVLLLPQTSAQQALLIAERICARAAGMRIENGNHPMAVTLSVGIAELQREPMDESIEDVVRRADQALYRAKESGRNRVYVHGAPGV